MSDEKKFGTGRVALVTGGAKRVGAEISRALAKDGWTVGIHYNTSEAEANQLAEELTARGGRCFLVQGDLTDRDQVECIIPSIVKDHRGIDLLVNNASTFFYDTIETLEWSSYDQHMEANLTAPLFLARDFSGAPGTAPDRCVVNILDQKVANLNPDFLSYTISKSALLCVTEVLAMTFAGRIRVNGIAPGLTLRSGKQTDESFEKAWRSPPLGRSSTPEEIAACLLFILASPSMIGQVIFLDGGQSLVKRPRDYAFDKTI